MSQPESPAGPGSHAERAPKIVGTFELFFDLVFIFAIIQVTTTVVTQPDLVGLGRGMVVLALLWWAWAAYAWLGNAVDTSGNGTRAVLLTAMAAMLVVAVSVPTAFTGNAWTFAIGYVVVRGVHATLYAITGERAILRLAPGFAVASGLLLAGAAFGGWPQVALWLVAIVIDYATPLVRGGRGFTLDPEHWAERHNLVVLLALGETVIATGVGVVAGGGHLELAVIAGMVVAIGTIGGMWWAYFDGESDRTRQVLARTQSVARIHLARDGYTYLHFVLVAGIVLAASGLEYTAAHPREPLSGLFPWTLGGGIALYLLGLAAIRWRRGDPLRPEHLAGAAVSLVAIPLAFVVPALLALGPLAVVLFVVALVDQRRTGAGPEPEPASGPA